MLISDVIAHFGSVEKAEQICGFNMRKAGISEMRPISQMRVYIASGGELAIDDNVMTLIMQIARIESKRMMSQEREIIVYACDHEPNASIDCANIRV